MKSLKEGFKILTNTEKELAQLQKRSLEKVIELYVKLLLFFGVLGGVYSIAFTMLRGVYLDFVKAVTINYLALLNYSLGYAATLFFFYVFAGTFGLFVVILIIKMFTRRKLIDLTKLLCYSLMPVLFFGWIDKSLAIGFLIWSIIILVLGLRNYKK